MTERAARRRPSWRTIALVLASCVLALVLALWLGRSVLVAALLRSALEARGARCAGLDVSASPALGELEIAPSRCTLEVGPVAELAWDQPMHVRVEGASVASIDTTSLAITRRPGDDEPEATGAAASVWMQTPARVSGLVHFAARLSQLDSPALSVERISVSLPGARAPELELERLRAPGRTAGAPVTIQIEALSLGESAGPLGISATPRLHDVRVEADPQRGTLEGTLDAALRVPVLGALSLGALTGEQRVRVTAEGLDASPRWHVELR